MEPILSDGDFVVIFKWFYKLNTGDIVAINHTTYGLIIKRVLSISKDGYISVCGENSTSLSTEKMGRIERELIQGRAIFSIKKKTLSFF